MSTDAVADPERPEDGGANSVPADLSEEAATHEYNELTNIFAGIKDKSQRASVVAVARRMMSTIHATSTHEDIVEEMIKQQVGSEKETKRWKKLVIVALIASVVFFGVMLGLMVASQEITKETHVSDKGEMVDRAGDTLTVSSMKAARGGNLTMSASTERRLQSQSRSFGRRLQASPFFNIENQLDPDYMRRLQADVANMTHEQVLDLLPMPDKNYSSIQELRDDHHLDGTVDIPCEAVLDVDTHNFKSYYFHFAEKSYLFDINSGGCSAGLISASTRLPGDLRMQLMIGTAACCSSGATQVRGTWTSFFGGDFEIEGPKTLGAIAENSPDTLLSVMGGGDERMLQIFRKLTSNDSVSSKGRALRMLSAEDRRLAAASMGTVMMFKIWVTGCIFSGGLWAWWMWPLLIACWSMVAYFVFFMYLLLSILAPLGIMWFYSWR